MAFRVLEIGAQTDSFARSFLRDACVSDKVFDCTLDVVCDLFEPDVVDWLAHFTDNTAVPANLAREESRSLR